MCVRLSSAVFALLLPAKGDTARTHASCQTLHSFVTQAPSRGNVAFGVCLSYIDKCICSREPRTKRAHFSVEENAKTCFQEVVYVGFYWIYPTLVMDRCLSRSSNELSALSDSERLKNELCSFQMAHEVNSMNYCWFLLPFNP
jgi:hypothetical protein